MDLEGAAGLALWNGRDPARALEYDVWHTREHVGERVAVPGMLGARRYRRVAGEMHEYFTYYDVETPQVLDSVPYRALLGGPSDWSRDMRPSFRGFFRLCCTRVHTAGGGIGGRLAAIPLEDAALLLGGNFLDTVREAHRIAGITAVHALSVDGDAAPVPFSIEGQEETFPGAGIVLLEGADGPAFDAALPEVIDRLDALCDQDLNAYATTYALAYALDRSSIGRLGDPPSTDLRARLDRGRGDA